LDVVRETYGIVVNQIDDFEAFVKFADKVGRFTTELLDDSGKRKREASENCIKTHGSESRGQEKHPRNDYRESIYA